ncbi:hypothetical protein ACC694_37910, partial [Rhizobium ruizarguesonis]
MILLSFRISSGYKARRLRTFDRTEGIDLESPASRTLGFHRGVGRLEAVIGEGTQPSWWRGNIRHAEALPTIPPPLAPPFPR